MVKYSLAFLAGNVFLHQFPHLNQHFLFQTLFAVLLTIILLFILRYFTKSCHYKKIIHSFLIASLFFLFSFGSSFYYAYQVLLNVFPEHLEAKEIVVQGYIDSIPIETEQSYKFNFKLHNIVNSTVNYASSQHPQRIRLSWYKNSLPPLSKVYNANVKNSLHNDINLKSVNLKSARLSVGDYWQFKVKLKRPSGLLNPGTMDYEKWLFTQQIQAVGYIRKSLENKPLLTQQSITTQVQYKHFSIKQNLIYSLDRLRQDMAEKLATILVNNEFKGIYLALTLGIKDQITDEQWSVFLDSGTNHLIAISGLHIGLLAAIGFFIGRHLWSLSGLLLRFLPAQMAGALSALLFAVSYAAMAGFSIPTQRALIMVILVLTAVFFRLRAPSSLVLSYALIVVLLIDPMASLSIAFWLSFTAVAIILYSLSNYREKDNQCENAGFIVHKNKINLILSKLKLIGKLSRMQVIIFLGLLPFSLLFFSRLLLLSPIANFIAVPWMSLIITPMVLFSSILCVFSTSEFFLQLSSYLFLLISYLMQPLWLFLQMINNMESNLIYPDIHNIVLTLLVISGLTLFFIFRNTKKRWFALVLLIPLFLPNELSNDLENKLLENISQRLWVKVPLGEFKVSVLDVGQGLSSIVQTQNHVMIYDTGNTFSPRFDMANQVVIPFLRHRSVHKIDKLILSHADHDHVGSAPSLLSSYQVDDILTGEPVRLTKKLAVAGEQCLYGKNWIWDQVKFQIMYPTTDDLNKKLKSNNLSCVILVTSAADQSLLLTGDIEKKIETKLLTLAQLKDTDIVIAPHHGSKSSSSQQFLDWLNPKIVVFTNGYLNRYHFPSQQVVKRYRLQESQLFSTQNGLIEMVSGDPELPIKVKEYRKDNRHYWNRVYKAIQ
jgi:competence protein ComEC